MKKIIILLILHIQLFAGYSYAEIEVTKEGNITSIKNSRSFISHMGEIPKNINITNKEELLLKLDSLIKTPKPDLIEIYNLIDQTQNLSNPEKSMWISYHVSDLPGPFLLLNAIYLAPTNPEEAVRWFNFGKMRIWSDVEKCRDKSVEAGIDIIKITLTKRFFLAFKEMKMGDIVKLAQAEEKSSANMYKTISYNIKKPYWIALHGMKSIIAGMDGKELPDDELFLPESEWLLKERMIVGEEA